jgi:hypothetical protein
MKLDYSIQYHAWTKAEMLELMTTVKKKFHFPFEVELVSENEGEVIFVLRKNS